MQCDVNEEHQMSIFGYKPTLKEIPKYKNWNSFYLIDVNFFIRDLDRCFILEANLCEITSV